MIDLPDLDSQLAALNQPLEPTLHKLLHADSDDRAHVFRSDAAQRSDLIARR